VVNLLLVKEDFIVLIFVEIKEIIPSIKNNMLYGKLKGEMLLLVFLLRIKSNVRYAVNGIFRLVVI
jgi:hypothetical protein